MTTKNLFPRQVVIIQATPDETAEIKTLNTRSRATAMLGVARAWFRLTLLHARMGHTLPLASVIAEAIEMALELYEERTQ